MIHRNVAKLFSANRGVSHLNEARCTNELSRGSNLGYKILIAFGFSDAATHTARLQNPKLGPRSLQYLSYHYATTYVVIDHFSNIYHTRQFYYSSILAITDDVQESIGK